MGAISRYTLSLDVSSANNVTFVVETVKRRMVERVGVLRVDTMRECSLAVIQFATQGCTSCTGGERPVDLSRRRICPEGGEGLRLRRKEKVSTHEKEK